MTRVWTGVAIGVALIVAMAAPAAAQNANVSGTLKDPSGAVLPGVNVRAVMHTGDGDVTRQAASDASGRYALTGLDAGTWTITASLPGFQTATQEVTLKTVDLSNWSPTLKIGTLQETVVITPAAPAAATDGTPTPVRVGGQIMAPKKVFNVAPVYPQELAAQGIQGVVILESTIGVDGGVTDVRVLRSIPLLDQAAMDAVRQWRFTPTLLNGQPVPVIMTVTLQFTKP